nr:premnaspirodiene oxygenase-like [Ipomoea trifida]
MHGVEQDMFAGGSETSTATTVWAMSEMMKNPRVMTKAQTEGSECREESIVNAYTIPLKTKVMINAWALGRDPEYWKNPESFISEIFEESSIDFTGNHFQYLSFGVGRRMCLRHAFGFANSMSPLAHLLFHFDWKLPNGVTVDSFNMT